MDWRPSATPGPHDRVRPRKTRPGEEEKPAPPVERTSPDSVGPALPACSAELAGRDDRPQQHYPHSLQVHPQPLPHYGQAPGPASPFGVRTPANGPPNVLRKVREPGASLL